MKKLKVQILAFTCLFSLQILAQRSDIEDLISNQCDKEAAALIKEYINMEMMTSVDAYHLMHFAIEYEQPLSFLAVLGYRGLDPRAVILEGTSPIRIFDLLAMTSLERRLEAVIHTTSFELIMSAFSHVVMLYNVLEHDNFAFLVHQEFGQLNFVFRAIDLGATYYSSNLVLIAFRLLNHAVTIAKDKSKEELQEMLAKFEKLLERQLEQTRAQLNVNQTQSDDANSDDVEWILPDSF